MKKLLILFYLAVYLNAFNQQTCNIMDFNNGNYITLDSIDIIGSKKITFSIYTHSDFVDWDDDGILNFQGVSDDHLLVWRTGDDININVNNYTVNKQIDISDWQANALYNIEIIKDEGSVDTVIINGIGKAMVTNNNGMKPKNYYIGRILSTSDWAWNMRRISVYDVKIYDGSDNLEHWWKGSGDSDCDWVDNVGVFGGVTHDYSNPSSVISVCDTSFGLIAYYPFTGSAIDYSGNGHNGTVTGATLTTDRNDNSNSAYAFGGASKYISIPVNLYNETSYTISAWYQQITNNGIYPPIYTSGSSFTDRKPWIFKNQTNNGFFNDIRKIGGNYYALLSNTTPDVSNWTHIVTTWNGTLLEIWINGVKDVNSLATPSYTLNYSGTAYIGKDISNSIYCGTGDKIDDIRIFNRVLTSDEIENLYLYNDIHGE